MQRRPRRVIPRQRNPRAARNPAYQIRPRYQLAPDGDPDGQTEPWIIDPVDEDADLQWRRPEPDEDEPADPEETSYQPEVQEATDAVVETSPESEPLPTAEVEEDAEPIDADDEQVTSEPGDDVAEPTAETPVVEPVDESDEPEDFSVYVKKIEEAAARSRAERRGVALASPRPVATTVAHPATGATSRQVPVVRRQHPANARAAARSGGGGGGGRGNRPPAPASQPFFRRRRTWVMIIALLVLVPVIVGLLYAGNVLRLGINAYQNMHTEPENRVRYRVNVDGTAEPVPPEEAEAALPDWGANDVVNIVLMGVDARSEDGALRSDTIIVVHVDPQTDEIAMMSIPRDLLVYIPGFGDEKMNAAFAFGDVNQDTIPGGGPTLVAQTIEANFNIPIHYYATVDFEGFERIVDTVGGVVIDVQAQLSDNLYPTNDLRLTRVYFGSGLQKMDGETALQYVRTRHADSDLARGQRQQEVLLAIRQKAVVRNLITRAPELIEDLGDTIRTDLDFNQLLALANLGRQIDPAGIARVDLWQEGILSEHFPEFEGDPYYLEADWDRVHALQAEFFDVPEPVATPTPEALANGDNAEADTAESPANDEPQPTPTEAVTEPDLDTPVMVENGTDAEMLAGHTAQFLFDSGFTAVWASDAEVPAEETVIYDSSGNPLTARHVADLLELNDSVIVPREGNGDIVVILGADFPSNATGDSDAETE